MRIRGGKDVVAIVLAIGMGIAINIITVAVLWDALTSEGPGLSENATQILITAFSGIIGILGAYLGFRTLSNRDEQETGINENRSRTNSKERGEDTKEVSGVSSTDSGRDSSGAGGEINGQHPEDSE